MTDHTSLRDSGARDPQPRVTIVTATYKTNREHLTSAIRSALNQTFADIEVIVSDDSPDDSLRAVAESFGDPRIRYVKNPRALGVAQNHWSGFREARGEYIAILNHDDCIDAGFIETLVRPLDDDPGLAFTFCDHWVIDGEGIRLTEATDVNSAAWGRADLRGGRHRPAYSLLAAQTVPMAMGSVFRRSLLPADMPANAGPAYDLWLAYLLCRGNAGAYYVPERLASWRAHADNITTRGAASWALGAAECWRAIFEDPSLAPIHSTARRKASAAYASCALHALQAGQRTQCLRFAWQAATARPTMKSVAAATLALLPEFLASRVLGAYRRRGPGSKAAGRSA